jgi:hypothetical protein
MERRYIRVDRNLTGVKNNLLTAVVKLEKNKRIYLNEITRIKTE